MVKVPEVERCCFCCPLRKGILLFGIINIIFSLAAVAWLVYTTELKNAKFIDGSLEEATSTVLFSIFGMSVILNILLLFAGCQKDIAMLRLFNCYAVAISLAAMVPTFILLSRAMYYDTGVALFAIENIKTSELDMSQQLLIRLGYVPGRNESDFEYYVFYLCPIVFNMAILGVSGWIWNNTMQCYVIVLVRSEVVKLELKIANREVDRSDASLEYTIDVGDVVTLL